MVGYKLGALDREMIVNDPRLQRLICRYCKCVVKEPTMTKCGHTFCLSCLENNCKIVQGLQVAVCTDHEEEQRLYLAESFHDEQAEKEVKLQLLVHCTVNGEQCEWQGQLGKLEMHLKDYHPHLIGEESLSENAVSGNSMHHDSARPDGEHSWSESQTLQNQEKNTFKAPSHGVDMSTDMLLNQYPLPPTLSHVAGPSGVSLLNAQGSFLENAVSGNSMHRDSARPDGEHSWSESQTLQNQQRMDHAAIELLIQQFAVLSDAFATVKHQVQVLEKKQSMDHTAIEQLKRHLAACTCTDVQIVTEKHERERLQDDVRTVEAKVQVQEQKQTVDQQQLAALSVAFESGEHHVERLQDDIRTAEGKVRVLEQMESVNQNDIEQLKQQLAVFDTERHDCERLQDDVRTVEGKIQVLDQELEAQKVRCTTARTECETGRARTYDDLNMESGILQGYIGRLQGRIANVQNERRQGSNGEGL